MRFSIDGWMVAWTPAREHWRWIAERGGPPLGSIEIGPWPDQNGWSDRHAMTGGCCMSERHGWSIEKKIAALFIDFHTCVVRDGVDVQAAHREFLKIDEYRRRISPDIDGAAP